MNKTFLWVMLFLSVILNAQSFMVKGKVSDFHNKTPLSNAKVVLGSYKTFTDNTGNFIFNNIPKGNYSLLVTHESCDDYSQQVFVDKNISLAIEVEHHAQELQTVKLNNTSKKGLAAVQESFNKDELDKKTTENLGNLISSMAGVSSLKTGNNIAKPVIHGLYGSRVVIMLDGSRLTEQEWGVEHSPSVDPQAFGKVSVIKGAGALKYSGDVIGGIVSLEQAPFPKKDTLFGNIILSGISNGRGGSAVAQITKTWQNEWFVKAQGSYKKLGDLSIPNTTLQNTGAEENGINFVFGKRKFMNGFSVSYNGIQQEFGIFKGSHLGGPEDFYQAVNSGNTLFTGNFSYAIEAPRQKVQHHTLKLDAYKRYADWGKFNLQYALQFNERQEYDIRRALSGNLPSLDLRLFTHSLKLEHLLERENWNWESGITAGFQDNYSNPIIMSRRLIPDYYRYDGAVYSVFQYQWSPKFSMEAGVRYDYNFYDAYKYYDQDDWDLYKNTYPKFFISSDGNRVLTRPRIGFGNFSSNVGFVYRFENENLIKVNFSRASRSPNAAELFAEGLHHSAALIEKGNLLLKQEIAHQVHVSFQGNMPVLEGLKFEINPYLMAFDNFINQIPTVVESSIRGVFPVWDYTQVQARLLGVDASSELKFNNSIAWKSQFSILRGDDLTHHEPLILMAPAQLRNGVEFQFKHWKNAYLKLENQTVFRQNRYPVRNFSIDLIENGTLVSRNVDYSTPPAGYSLFHLYAGIDLFKKLQINVSVQNIFNREYREYLNRLRFFSPEMGRNIVLSFNYKF